MKIGIDIGGSHIGIGLVNSNGTIILKEEKFIKDKSNIEKKIEEYITENVIKMFKLKINQKEERKTVMMRIAKRKKMNLN